MTGNPYAALFWMLMDAAVANAWLWVVVVLGAAFCWLTWQVNKRRG